ncbi:MAG TPA: tetratricopeptide repeat protein [Candidatus Acidoferrum sp.]|nr:tetratricopeptide repeat protein [Candidatus Acidoferrum sp.]
MPRLLPWFLAVAAFVVYGLTLNRSVSLASLNAVAKISGWTWVPELSNPVSFLITYPLRWLPATQIPLALNLFSALCAALTLGLLARSVALLPHDRTEAQRKRERSDFSFLTIRSAWLPPVLAVIVCGLQLSFWENATNYTGEMVDLMLFAFVIWSLLEYRLDEREGRLYLAALVFGASLANNWAMLGFFPAFIAALIWIRGLRFFHLRFLRRMLLGGLLGVAFYWLLPVLAVTSGKAPLTFWEAMKANLAPQFQLLKLLFFCCLHPQAHLEYVALLLAYLLPLIILAVRWGTSFGDHSPVGTTLTNFLFHLACAAFLGFTLWMAFDPPFSPRYLSRENPLLPFYYSLLTLYYLGALNIGYFSGYFLLIFGTAPTSRLSNPRPEPLQFLNPVVFAGLWLLAAITVTGLIYRNRPQLREINDDTFKTYASFVTTNLPRSGGIMLSDDVNRLYFAEAALVREGRSRDWVPVDTRSLYWPNYLRFLHAKYPQRWPEMMPASETKMATPMGLVTALNILAKTNALFYLHPSFGYYFEQFYQEPHGLVYQLKPLPEGTLLPPPPDPSQIAANEQFWSAVAAQTFPPIERAVEPPDPNAPRSRGERLLARFHVPRERNHNAVAVGAYYSRSLDFWGVQLQRVNELEKAAVCFDRAIKINPDNVVAQINLAFNQNLRAGKTVPVDLSRTTSDQFGKYRDWLEVLSANGPFDEPSFCLAEGLIYAAQNGFYRQAVAPLTRVRELVPDNLPARLWLGQIYAICRQPDRALEALRDPLEQPEKFSLARTNLTEMNLILATAYFQKNDLAQGTRLLDAEIARHPADDNFRNTVVQVYVSHNLFTNALALVDDKLRSAPDDPLWLFNQGYLLIQVKAYDEAIAALTRVLAIQTNNHDARFDRAIACLNSGKLEAAQADYRILQQTLTNSIQVAYGLGEIAWRQRNTNEAVRNYRLYLANTDTNTDEAKVVAERLRELKGHSP